MPSWLRDRSPLADRLREAGARDVCVLPAEHVTLLTVELPLRSDRQRLAALPFAVEDRLATPLGDTHLALCGRGPGGRVVAAAVARDLMAEAAEAAPDRPILPEHLALPTQQPAAEGAPSWAAFRSGTRVVVRVSDGSGFATHAAALPGLWIAAGRPPVTSLGEPLPDGVDGVTGEDRPPAPADLSADLRQGAFRPPSGWAGPLRAVAAAAALVVLLHVALAWADLRALRALAEDTRARTEATLSGALPSATVFDDPALVLARLSSRDEAGGGGPVRLLDRVSEALLGASVALTVDRLVWSTAPDTLSLSVTAPTLEALQEAEEALRLAGLSVASGTATANESGAQSDLTIRAGDGG